MAWNDYGALALQADNATANLAVRSEAPLVSRVRSLLTEGVLQMQCESEDEAQDRIVFGVGRRLGGKNVK
jgi:hypothetical protein